MARVEKLCEILKVMCNIAIRSLREGGMCILPWIKFRYKKFKWVGIYKRTTKPTGSRDAHGTYNEKCGLLHFLWSGIVLKATRWDVSIIQLSRERPQCH